MIKMRRFPIDPRDADVVELDEEEAPTRRRPADKRLRRPHDDKSHAPTGDDPDGHDR